jgi:hypothetical protein
MCRRDADESTLIATVESEASDRARRTSMAAPRRAASRGRPRMTRTVIRLDHG